MADASTTGPISTELAKVAERAKREPAGKFHSLAHLIDVAALRRAYNRLRNDAGVGVDGVTKEQYGQKLEENLQGLHRRLVAKQYRHQPLRRVHIPKEGGKTRPIGISALEDKIVQGAVKEVLEAIYEQDFLPCSYGFRPERSAHDALRTLDGALRRGEVNIILEMDIVSFFDSMDRSQLREMLQERVADGSLLRLIGKCLHVGILDGEVYSEPETGSAQGSILSPLLGNIYLHYVLDLWFESEVKPRMGGKALLIRYADDAVMGFERREDAERVMEVLGKRLGRYGLKLHPDKTRLVPFERPTKRQQGGKGPGTFDFLGFTLYWRRTPWGSFRPACKTRHARLTRAINAVTAWCRRHRHQAIKDQHAALKRRLVGHFNYFGVLGNRSSLQLLVHHAERAWHKWLCRRSHKAHLNWKRFKALLRDYPLPRPKVLIDLGAT